MNDALFFSIFVKYYSPGTELILIKEINLFWLASLRQLLGKKINNHLRFNQRNSYNVKKDLYTHTIIKGLMPAGLQSF